MLILTFLLLTPACLGRSEQQFLLSVLALLLQRMLLAPILLLPPHLLHPPWGFVLLCPFGALSHRVQLFWASPDPLRQGNTKTSNYYYCCVVLMSRKNHIMVHLLPLPLLHFRGTKPNSGKIPLSPFANPCTYFICHPYGSLCSVLNFLKLSLYKSALTCLLF